MEEEIAVKGRFDATPYWRSENQTATSDTLLNFRTTIFYKTQTLIYETVFFESLFWTG